MMVEYPHELIECEKCGTHYCMGCVGEQCPSCKLQEVSFYAIELEEKLKTTKKKSKAILRRCKELEEDYDAALAAAKEASMR